MDLRTCSATVSGPTSSWPNAIRAAAGVAPVVNAGGTFVGKLVLSNLPVAHSSFL